MMIKLTHVEQAGLEYESRVEVYVRASAIDMIEPYEFAIAREYPTPVRNSSTPMWTSKDSMPHAGSTVWVPGCIAITVMETPEEVLTLIEPPQVPYRYSGWVPWFEELRKENLTSGEFHGERSNE